LERWKRGGVSIWGRWQKIKKKQLTLCKKGTGDTGREQQRQRATEVGQVVSNRGFKPQRQQEAEVVRGKGDKQQGW
jgi:hypothetical protein